VSAVWRIWIAFAAVGAGLIHLALSVNAPVGFGTALAVLGVALFAWGVLVVFDERFLVPRISVVGVLTPIALWLVLLALGETIQFAPLAIATALELFVAAVLAVHLRRGIAPVRTVSTGRFVVAVALGAIVIVAVTAPALAATQAATTVLAPDEVVHH
jgi:hypothetical protein